MALAGKKPFRNTQYVNRETKQVITVNRVDSDIDMVFCSADGRELRVRLSTFYENFRRAALRDPQARKQERLFNDKLANK